MNSRVDWKLGIENTTPDSELLQEKFQSVTSVNVGHEYNTFPLDQLEFENDVKKQELFIFCASKIWSAKLCT